MSRTKRNQGKIVIKGGVYASRDVVMGDQNNYFFEAKINSREDFFRAISFLRTQLVELLDQPNLNLAARKNVQEVDEKLKEVEKESKNAKQTGESIRKTLVEAKEYLDIIASSIQSASMLGSLIGNLAQVAIQLFGK